MAQPRARPFALDPLFAPLTALEGVGARGGKALARVLGGDRVLDALHHLPTGIIDRRHAPPVAEARPGEVATLRVAVHKHFPPDRRGVPWRTWCADETGTVTLVFFHPRAEWIRAQLPEGARVVVSGRVELRDGRPQIVHPDAIGPPEDFEAIAVMEPTYPLGAGVTNRVVRRAVAGALERLPDLAEWADPALVAQKRWPRWADALRAVHAVAPGQDAARARLAYDEFLAQQMTLALVRARAARAAGAGRAIPPAPGAEAAIRAAAGFTLTGAQERALAEISADLAAPRRMARLLQGDVGSGKTIVAALAIARVAASGAQAALMAPTEILARQHAKTLAPWMAAAGIPTLTLTGRDKGPARREALARIASGAVRLVIGTHAIFQEEVAYHDLALAVVDEQHKFGVEQRLALAGKGRGVDLLLMSATPIPRSLSLVAYGDLDASRLDEKPPGRTPVDTRVLPAERLEALIAGLARRVADGARVYWVCPLVEESAVVDFTAAQERFEDLRARFGPRVGLVHGRMDAADKDAVMADFASGALDILVATTVIEVGVDVPEAAVMVVERAERFGLAQLHQLRGRVGRGAGAAHCFLIYDGTLSAAARTRLEVLRRSDDGFVIAEEDLKLRGAGDILGLRQSGEPAFRFGDPAAQADLLATAQADARAALSKDPDLASARGQALRCLLYLMERDRALRYLKAG
jgi:ATP-dependent DNA helicase RecG